MKETATMAKTTQKPITLAEAKTIGEKLGINWEAYDVNEFRLGLNTEIADGLYNPITYSVVKDPIQIGKVVRGHLNEVPNYYTQWSSK